MSKLETLFPLANGMTIVIAKKDEAIDASAVEKLIIENEVEIIQTTPSRMKLLMENSTFKKALQQIKFVLVGGEQMPSNLAEEIIKFNNLEFYNMYGPTETTVWSTAKKVENKDLTIGKPIQNTKVYILDKDLNMLPIGIVGELCISGDGVGRGYLNNEELTNEKFIDNPFEHGKKLYKTGDLARWRSDGEIDFIGRVDHQVKIRGYRIELSEIESKLLEITGIKEAVVIDKTNGDSKYLCAYYVSNKEYTVGELREELKKTLPEYMLPSYFINMDVLPLNNNGKIDRKSLPEIQGKINTGTEYEAPENEIEASMVEICKEVLGLQHLGVRDNLFEVGSNSITVVKICNKLKENNINISIKDIFYYENIRDIYRKCIYKEEAAADEELEDNNDIINLNISEIKQNLMEQINRFNNTILQQNIVETYCTSAIQKMSKEANITFSAVVMDFDYKVNIGLLKKSIVSVINTQSLLRSIIINFEDKMKIQEHEKVADIKIPYLNLEKVNESKRENIIEYIINEFYGENLQNEQSLFDKILYKIIIVKFSDKKYKLYMPFNHLIFDGMSNEIIKVNILRAYSNNGISKEDNSLGYHEYVNQLMEGPREVTEKEIMEKFNLDNFNEGYKEYFHKLSNTKLINATI
jgi:aryl carrier-like protein